jgi:hypothetical protein
MKQSTILRALALVGGSAAAAIEKRQLGANAPIQKTFKVENISPVVRSDAKRLKITYGPYKIKGANDASSVGNGRSMDPHGTGYSYLAGEDFPRDVTVLEAASMMVDENFKRADLADGLYNHHNVFYDLSHELMPVLQCGTAAPKSSLPMAVFMAGATETGTIGYAVKNSTLKSGFYIGKNDKIVIGIDMVNYKDTPRTLYSVSEIEFLPGKSGDLLPAEQMTLDIGTCGGAKGTAIHVPKDQTKYSIRGQEITVAKDGYFINMRGHLHDGGKNMVVKLNDKEICDSHAVYGGVGHEGKGPDGKVWKTVSETTRCPPELKVNKGDKLVIEANYDVEAHPQRESSHGEMAEGMALWVGTFVGGTA